MENPPKKLLLGFFNLLQIFYVGNSRENFQLQSPPELGDLGGQCKATQTTHPQIDSQYYRYSSIDT